MSRKKPLGENVYNAAKKRISYIFDSFPRIYLSFSGGKDSSVMLHMVMDEAVKRGRKIGLLFVDLEAQYKMTIDYVEECFVLYSKNIENYWIALPLSLRNAVSMYEPKWICWDPGKLNDWVRRPPRFAISDKEVFPFFTTGMEFEDFVDSFGHWYSKGELTACFVGIRSDESLNRFRSLAMDKSQFQNLRWTTYKSQMLYNCYPIYDWKTRDIWIYNGKFRKPYNRLYDIMAKAGLSIHEQRICQPYGDDQRKGLWLYHAIEPETWGRVVARVNGANSGALYAQEKGNILGRIKITKPDGHTWQSFAILLLETLPPKSKEHYENKVAVFLKWYEGRGYPNGIPDEADPKLEAGRRVPSWRRICKSLLRNDYWCKGLSFSQTRSESYQKYTKIMKKRRASWGVSW